MVLNGGRERRRPAIYVRKEVPMAGDFSRCERGVVVCVGS
jgi:hypothetical protein